MCLDKMKKKVKVKSKHFLKMQTIVIVVIVVLKKENLLINRKTSELLIIFTTLFQLFIG